MRLVNLVKSTYLFAVFFIVIFISFTVQLLPNSTEYSKWSNVSTVEFVRRKEVYSIESDKTTPSTKLEQIEDNLTTIYESSRRGTIKYGNTFTYNIPMIRYWDVCTDHKSHAEHTSIYYRKVKTPRQSLYKRRKLKKILLWNPFFHQKDYNLGFENTIFDVCNCPVSCWLTSDKRYLKIASAVVVHAFYLKAHQTVLPTRSSKNQIFVFYQQESPTVAWQGMFDYQLNDVFNLTITYLDHPDTDIYAPVGDIVHGSYTSDPSLERLKGKTRSVAWVTSNCHALGQRWEYVHELSKYIDVDVFGKCGKLSCPDNGDYGEECLRNLSQSYFFYLSFENSYCDGYITEKAFRPLFHSLVPVVYGGGAYSSLLPPNSFIDVRDFNSPKALAEHLVHLRRHPDEYLEYLSWKNDWTAKGDDYHRARSFCKLCKILNTKHYPYKSNFDVLDYWNPDKLCLSGEEEKLAVHLMDD